MPGNQEPSVASGARRPGFVSVVPVLAFVSGAAALTYESLWMRSFGLIFGVTTDAVSVTLVTFMGGLALGGWLVSRIRLRRLLLAYAVVEAGIGVSALLTLPITTAFGFSFPLLVHLVAMEGWTPQQVSGLLCAWNTLGAIAGALVTSFLLVPGAGIQASYAALAALPLAAGLVVIAGDRPWTSGRRAAACAGLELAVLGAGLWWRPWDSGS